jgi:hypothetical protein
MMQPRNSKIKRLYCIKYDRSKIKRQNGNYEIPALPELTLDHVSELRWWYEIEGLIDYPINVYWEPHREKEPCVCWKGGISSNADTVYRLAEALSDAEAFCQYITIEVKYGRGDAIAKLFQQWEDHQHNERMTA